MQGTLWLTARWSCSCRVPAQSRGRHATRNVQCQVERTGAHKSQVTRRELLYGIPALMVVLNTRGAIAGETGSDASKPAPQGVPSGPKTPSTSTPAPGTTTTITAPTAPPSNPILSDSNGKPAEKLSDEEAKALLDEEEARRRARRRNKGRLQELQEIRAELAEREAELLEKEKELLEKEQTVAVLREELEIEKRLRVLLSKEKERAAEEASLAMGLCGPLGL